eukprot:4782567-Prymnesium_polylepis.1
MHGSSHAHHARSAAVARTLKPRSFAAFRAQWGGSLTLPRLAAAGALVALLLEPAAHHLLHGL